MTVVLYGSEICTACKLAKDALGRTPIDWMYQDVSVLPNYLGIIPVLVLEDGQMLEGLGAINMFITQWKQENGFL